MRHRSDEANGGAAREARVGVERDDVADVRRHRRPAIGEWHERRVRSAAEKPVQLLELAALALPTHPLSLALVPDAASVEKKESPSAPRDCTMAGVQPRDPRCRRGEEVVIAGRMLDA